MNGKPQSLPQLTAAGQRNIADRITEEYHAPIALACGHTLALHREKFMLSFYQTALPVLLRYMTLTLLSDYRAQRGEGPRVAQQASKVLGGRAGEGRWLELLGYLVDYLSRPERSPFLPELIGSIGDARTGRREPWWWLDELVSIRNRLHRCESPPDVLLEEEERIRLLLLSFLREQDWMRRYVLAVTDRSDRPECLLGGAGPLTAPSCPGHLHLYSPGLYRSLLLDPFVVCRPCMHCTAPDDSCASEVFTIEQVLTRRAQYRGLHYMPRPQDSDLLSDVRQATADILKFEQADGEDPIAAILDRAKSLTDETISDYVAAGKYIASAFVQPPQWAERLRTFFADDRPTMILTAPAGAGKSCLLCNTAGLLQASSHVVIFWDHNRFPSGSISSRILTLLDTPAAATFEELADFIRGRIRLCDDRLNAKFARLVVIIDGLNERARDRLDAFHGVMEFAREVLPACGSTVKIILGLRDRSIDEFSPAIRENLRYIFHIAEVRGGIAVDSPVVRIEPFTDLQLGELFDRYKERFNFHGELDALQPAARNMLRHPLFLRLAAEIYSCRDLPFSFAGGNLFEQHILTRASRYPPTTAQRLQRLLTRASRKMYEREEVLLAVEWFLDSIGEEFGWGDLDALYNAATDEGFFTETRVSLGEFSELRFRFTFERCLEFLLGRYILPQRVEHLGLDGMLMEIQSKSGYLPQLKSALRVYIRALIGSNPNRAAEALRRAVEVADEIGAHAASELLCEAELAGEYAIADSFYEMIDQLPAAMRIAPLGLAMKRTFDLCPEGRLVALGSRHADACILAGDEYLAAETLLWIGDVYYNRGDKYALAIDHITRAIERLESIQERDHLIELLRAEAQYFLARVLSDCGERAAAERIAERCMDFFEASTDPRAQRGLALAHILLYMIRGDAAGRFASSIHHLTTAETILHEQADSESRDRALLRVGVNKSIAALYLQTEAEAVEIAKTTVSRCEASGDLQAEAYAQLCLAAIRIQNLVLPQDRGGVRETEAVLALDRVDRIHAMTHEDFLSAMSDANRGVLAILNGDTARARTLFDSVMEKSSQDFFNLFDAEVMVVGSIDRDRTRLEAKLTEAQEHGYEQGELHVLWHLHRVSGDCGDGVAAAEYARLARAKAAELGWGDDPRESLQMGFYAGIFV